MRKKAFSILPVVSLFCLFTFASCQKEGPQGIQGPQGVQGPAGEDGQDAQVKIFVKDLEVTTTAWKYDGNGEQASLDVAEITDKVITGGIVLVYIIMDDQLFMLPYTTGHELFRHSFKIGKVTIWREPADGKSVGKPQKDRHFRVVVIPNAISGRVKSQEIPDLLSTEHLNDIYRKVML